jgi:hypothetical protein
MKRDLLCYGRFIFTLNKRQCWSGMRSSKWRIWKLWVLRSLGLRPLGLLGSRIRIPLGAGMFVSWVYVVLFCVGIGLCDGLISRPEESYRVYLTLRD